MATVLISIKPRFVKLIVAGKKRYELRRGNAAIQPGDMLIVYSTSPEKAIVATCRVKGKLTGTPGRLFKQIDGASGIGRQEYYAYLSGAGTATALELEAVETLATPVTLERLRKMNKAFTIPRSYRFLRECELGPLEFRGRLPQ